MAEIYYDSTYGLLQEVANTDNSKNRNEKKYGGFTFWPLLQNLGVSSKTCTMLPWRRAAKSKGKSCIQFTECSKFPAVWAMQMMSRISWKTGGLICKIRDRLNHFKNNFFVSETQHIFGT
jgi:hypothetical protein